KRRVVGYKDSGLDKGSGSSAVKFAGKGRAANGLVPVTESMTSDGRRWSGYGTALKPAVEPISLCCKPYKGTIADCALEHGVGRSEEHTSELQSLTNLVCRLLLEKK